MLGTRGMWENGWKAVAMHAPLSSKGHFDKDVWELYHVDVDRAESKNLAKEHPEKLEALIKAWFEEADKNFVLPLDDRTAMELFAIERPTEEVPRERYIYYPGTGSVPESVAVNVRGRSYKILADVQVGDDCAGVIFAHGSRFGGHSLFIKNKKLHYVYNFLGIPPEQKFVSPELKPGKYTLGMEFTRESAGKFKEAVGKTKLYVNDKVVAEGPMRAQVGKFTLCGDGLCVGFDSADAVSHEYEGSNPFKGGTIQFVGVTIEKAQVPSIWRHSPWQRWRSTDRSSESLRYRTGSPLRGCRSHTGHTIAKFGYARRVMPESRWGSWEVFGRYSHVDLDDQLVKGGVMDNDHEKGHKNEDEGQIDADPDVVDEVRRRLAGRGSRHGLLGSEGGCAAGRRPDGDTIGGRRAHPGHRLAVRRPSASRARRRWASRSPATSTRWSRVARFAWP